MAKKTVERSNDYLTKAQIELIPKYFAEMAAEWDSERIMSFAGIGDLETHDSVHIAVICDALKELVADELELFWDAYYSDDGANYHYADGAE